jgi:hypothetical protein
MKFFLAIPENDFPGVISELNQRLNFPSETRKTSFLNGKKPKSDGKVYVSCPDSWPADLLGPYTIDEAEWTSKVS